MRVLTDKAATQPASALPGANWPALHAEMDLLDELAVRYYSQAIKLAAALNVQSEAVSRARHRLSYLAGIIDPLKLRGILNRTSDPAHPSWSLTYRDDMFAPPGLPAVPPPNGTAPPAPVP